MRGFYFGISPSMMYRPRLRRRLQRDKFSSPRQWVDTRVLYIIIYYYFRLSNGFLALSRGNHVGANAILTFCAIIMLIPIMYINNIYCITRARKPNVGIMCTYKCMICVYSTQYSVQDDGIIHLRITLYVYYNLLQ